MADTGDGAEKVIYLMAKEERKTKDAGEEKSEQEPERQNNTVIKAR